MHWFGKDTNMQAEAFYWLYCGNYSNCDADLEVCTLMTIEFLTGSAAMGTTPTSLTIIVLVLHKMYSYCDSK